MHKLVDLFCHVDDFCKVFLPQWKKLQLEGGERKRNRKGHMSESEMMTIIVAFHMSHQRDFKNFYLGMIHRYHKSEFPTLLSYTSFLEVMPSVLVPLSSFFTHVKGEPTGIEFIDSTSIKVCHNLRIPRHKVFKGTGARGKGTMGWFYGFKLHIILDGAGYHRSDLVKEAATVLNIELHYLPPHSPNLNPIERQWKVMNEKSRNNVYFKAAIDQFFTVTLPEIAGSLISRINDNFQVLKPASSS